MKKHLLIFISLFIAYSSFGQNCNTKENDIWYFGNHAGITFNTPDNSPVAIEYDASSPTEGNAMNQLEGCASISSTTGELLFYTDGMTVWNSDNSVIESGLDGAYSSATSATIVAHPTDENIYYIFTVDDIPYSGISKGIRYSIIKYVGGAWQIAALDKNKIVISGKVKESLTVLPSTTPNEVWLVGHLSVTFPGSNSGKTWVIFKLDANGIVSPAQLQQYGDVDHSDNITAIRASRDGKKIATSTANNGIGIYEFDNTNGIFVEKYEFTTSIIFSSSYYGCEFSPNGTKLYVSQGGTVDNIMQYDLGVMNALSIQASEAVLPAGNGDFAALQLGPDNKIYFAKNSSSSLGIITNPNDDATSLIFDQVSLGTGISNFGLPNYVDITQTYDLKPSYTSSNILCGANAFQVPLLNYGSASIIANNGFSPYTYSWDGPGSFSSSQSSITGLGAPGTYTVTMTDANYCQYTHSFGITQPGSVTQSFPVTDALCYGENGNYGLGEMYVGGGTSPYQIYKPSGAPVYYPQMYSVPAGMYSGKIVDANACHYRYSIKVRQPVELLVNVWCGTTGINQKTLYTNVSGGTPPYNYLWDWEVLGQANYMSQNSSIVLNNASQVVQASLTVTDANGCTVFWSGNPSSMSCKMTRRDVGYENADIRNQIKIYPNPAREQLNVELSNSDVQIESIVVLNELSQELISVKGIENNINISALKAGIYIIKIQTTEGLTIKQFVKE